MYRSTLQTPDQVLKNARKKIYPDGSFRLLVASRPVFVPDGWERDKERPEALALTPDEIMDRLEGDLEGGAGIFAPDTMYSRQRAKMRVRDISLCTPFSYFVTLTIAPDKLNRYDIGSIMKTMRAWLSNRVERDGLAYVLVPERHKDGAIHFHGFFNDALPVVDSGTMTPGTGAPKKPRSALQRASWLSDGWHIVYNLPDWDYGFTTAIELYGEYPRAVNYVVKYIGKQTEKIGGRWYYSGGKLGEPDIELFNLNYEDVIGLDNAYIFAIKDIKTSFCQIDVAADG